MLLAHLYPQGKKHPVYRTFTGPSRSDPARLLLRKALVATLATRPAPAMLLRVLLLLERWRVPDPILFKAYHLLWAVHMHNGFREGLRRLAQLEAARV